ncbi:MAG: DMT family transporter [Bacteroidales bacterium]
MRIDLEKRSWQWILLVFLAFIWGASFILMKRGLESFTGLQVGAMRLFFSFVFFLPLIYYNLKKVTRENIRSLLIVGFVGNGIPALLFATAQTEINSSLAGILNSLTPIFTLLIGILLYGNKVRWLSIAGLITGLIGAGGLILSVNNLGIEGTNKWYGLLAVVATVCYGINVNEIKFGLKELDGIAIASLGFIFIGPLSGIYLLSSDYSLAAGSPVMVNSLLAVAGLAFFSSFIAIIVMNILIKFTTTLFAASVTYIIPIFAVFWGIMDGERFLLVQAFWAFVVLAGVYLVNQKGQNKTNRVNKVSGHIAEELSDGNKVNPS